MLFSSHISNRSRSRPTGSACTFAYFPEIPSQCITSEGVPPSWHSMCSWPHLQFKFFRQWPISEGVFRSKTRQPTVHPFCCWLRLQSGFYALSFSFPWPNKYSVFFHFYSVNLAHLPFRLGYQEGVLIHHRINFPRLAISHHLLFEAAHGQTPARAAYSRVATHRPPFVRRHYCRTPTTTQSVYQFHLVCVIVWAAKETIFLLSKTPVSSGSATNSHRNLTDLFIIGVLLIYSICIARTFS